MATTIARVSTTCRTAALAAVVVLLADAWAEPRPLREPVVLFEGAVQASALADATVYAVASNTLYRASLDHLVWETIGRIPLEECHETVTSLRAVAGDPDHLLALTARHICLSRDAGLTWSFRRLDAEACLLHDIHPVPGVDGGLLLATSDGVWVSRDNAHSFERFFARMDEAENHVTDMALSPDGVSIYLATRGGLFCSLDAGTTFGRITGLPDAPVTHLAQSPVTAGAVAFISAGRLFYSSTKLAAYAVVSLTHDFTQCGQVVLAPDGDDVIWSTPKGIMRGMDWLAGRETRIPTTTVARRFPSMEEIASNVTSLAGAGALDFSRDGTEAPAAGDGTPASEDEDDARTAQPFVRKPVIDTEAAAQD